MGKLLDRLNKQLETEYKEDAENCIKIFNGMKEITGSVSSNLYREFVETIFKGFPSDERRFKPTSIGYVFLKGLQQIN